jgi:two-component system sensor histidine kinase ComP
MLESRGVAFDCRIEDEPPIGDETRLILFHALRELFHNVIKHAHAKNVKSRVWKREEMLCITVEDDGTGFDPLNKAGTDRTSFGLFSIREQLRHLEGTLAVNSVPTQGTRATITVPMISQNHDQPVRGEA